MVDPVDADKIEKVKEITLESESDSAREKALERLIATTGYGGKRGDAAYEALHEIALEADDDEIAERATEEL